MRAGFVPGGCAPTALLTIGTFAARRADVFRKRRREIGRGASVCMARCNIGSAIARGRDRTARERSGLLGGVSQSRSIAEGFDRYRLLELSAMTRSRASDHSAGRRKDWAPVAR